MSSKPTPQMSSKPTTVRSTNAALSSSLRVSVLRLARRMRAERELTSGLGLTQVAAMGTLDRHGPMSIGELAAHERVRPPSMTRTVSSLVDLGLVTRQPHPTDRRQIVVDLAPEGRHRLTVDRRRKDAWLVRRLAELTSAERDLLRAAAPVLERLAGP